MPERGVLLAKPVAVQEVRVCDTHTDERGEDAAYRSFCLVRCLQTKRTLAEHVVYVNHAFAAVVNARDVRLRDGSPPTLRQIRVYVGATCCDKRHDSPKCAPSMGDKLYGGRRRVFDMHGPKIHFGYCCQGAAQRRLDVL